MKLTFLGACHEVTGSMTYLEACGKKILIDCGMEQGGNVFENAPLPVAPGEIDFVLLTHAHIDHSGNLPLLCKNGFKGEIHSTDATADLCNIMLKDSAHIQEFEAEWQNRKNKRAGKAEFIPIYTMEDAISAIGLFVPHFYKNKFLLCDGIEVNFIDAGHLLGSGSIEVWATENGTTKKIVFSGDIGNMNQPIIKNPQYISDADFVVMESTYGNRNHNENPDYVRELVDVLQTTFDRGGNVVIPSFAVGRTQEMLYFLRQIKQDKLVKPNNFTVYVDSPLAVEATNVFKENGKDCFDSDTMELIRKGINPISFDGLKVSVTQEDSKYINFDQSPKVILSASGMCDAGRIKHHLKHNLWREESTILFVGYQANGSLGRKIIEGADEVKLFGETIEVKAEIKQLAGISGHADNNGLVKWIDSIAEKPSKVFIVHGEDEAASDFAFQLSEKGYDAAAPYSGAVYDLLEDVFLLSPPPVQFVKETPPSRADGLFARLVSAGKRLMSIIERNRGLSNKDVTKFTSQIDALCDKWSK
ncbi:MAG: MBL fold metallo-hydrolase [Oscillospiraceae bacterium]